MRFVVFVFLLFTVVIVIDSCTKDKAPISAPFEFSDKQLFVIVSDTTNRKFYKNNPNLLPPASSSPHGSFRLWFNPKAQTVLDASGKLPVNGIFPDSSLLVKEVLIPLFDSIPVLAVMYKLQGSWKWAEYEFDGDVVYSIKKDPSACVSCHSLSPNRDLVRTFDLH